MHARRACSARRCRACRRQARDRVGVACPDPAIGRRREPGCRRQVESRQRFAGDDVALCNLEQQRRFFRAHLQPWVGKLCDAVAAHPRADTWRAVAAMTRAFVEVEAQGFDLLEA